MTNEQYILDILRSDYKKGIKELKNKDIDYEKCSDEFLIELRSILEANNYLADENDKFASYCSVAYYVSLKNNYQNTINNVKPNFNRVAKTISRELLEIEANDMTDFADKIEKYKGVLSDDELANIIIEVNLNKEEITEGFNDFLELYNEECIDYLYEEIKRKNFKITDNNRHLLDNPAFVIAGLEGENRKEVINLLKSRIENGECILGDVRFAISNELFDRLEKVLISNNILKENLILANADFYIALIGIKNGFIDANVFLNHIVNVEKYFYAEVSSLNKAMEIFINLNNINKRLITDVIYWGYFSDSELIENYYEDIVDLIKRWGMSPLYLPYNQLSKKIKKRLVKDRIITNSDLKIIELMNCNDKYSLEMEEYAIKLAKLDKKVTTVEEAVSIIKDKDRSNMSFEEMNLLYVYIKKVEKEKNVDIKQVDLFLYTSFDDTTSLAATRRIDEDYLLFMYNPRIYSVEEMVDIVRHEINHISQFEDMKNINVKDEDLLEHSKDYMLMRILKSQSYYNKYYLSISFEYDADMKSSSENAIIFNKEKELLSDYSGRISKSKYDKKRGYKRSFKRGNKYLIDFFDDVIKQEFNNYEDYKEIIDFINARCPIISYEYDLDKARIKSMEELIIDMNESSGKEKEIYKCIIKGRCNKFKVGEKRAKENHAILKKMKNSCNKELEDVRRYTSNIKTSIDKYNEYFLSFKKTFSQQNINNLKNKTK